MRILIEIFGRKKEISWEPSRMSWDEFKSPMRQHERDEMIAGICASLVLVLVMVIIWLIT